MLAGLVVRSSVEASEPQRVRQVLPEPSHKQERAEHIPAEAPHSSEPQPSRRELLAASRAGAALAGAAGERASG